jgi:MFS family permease
VEPSQGDDRHTTVLQTIVDDDKRGRIMSFFTMAFMGMTPFGSLLSGFLAGIIGAQNTLLLGGAACLIGAAVFAGKLPELRKLVRPIYVQKRIVSEIATGIQSAIELTMPERKSL